MHTCIHVHCTYMLSQCELLSHSPSLTHSLTLPIIHSSFPHSLLHLLSLFPSLTPSSLTPSLDLSLTLLVPHSFPPSLLPSFIHLFIHSLLLSPPSLPLPPQARQRLLMAEYKFKKFRAEIVLGLIEDHDYPLNYYVDAARDFNDLDSARNFLNKECIICGDILPIHEVRTYIR